MLSSFCGSDDEYFLFGHLFVFVSFCLVVVSSGFDYWDQVWVFGRFDEEECFGSNFGGSWRGSSLGNTWWIIFLGSDDEQGITECP